MEPAVIASHSSGFSSASFCHPGMSGSARWSKKAKDEAKRQLEAVEGMRRSMQELAPALLLGEKRGGTS